jgi:hypothetical protein
MEGFIKIGDALINTDRLITVSREEARGRIAAHYLAVFDTGQKLMLSLEEGAELSQRLYERKPSDGTMATNSESAI